MGKEKIYQKDTGYTLLKPFVDWCTRRSYRRIKVLGKENIPSEGAVILAPNHCNTLMDALVILQAHRDETVFGARADMFKKPLIAKIMFFLRILPMVRQRDGLRNVLKNYESFETIVETLEHDVRFCMYPEGRHRPARSLLPLGKGILRAAIAANNRFGERKPVYIVPTGIEYGDYFRYRSTCLITFGEAINVTEFIKGMNAENEAQVMEPLRRELHERMSKLISYIPDDGKVEEKWALTEILTADCTCSSLEGRKDLNNRTISRILTASEAHPEEMAALTDRAASFKKRLEDVGIDIKSLDGRSLTGKAIMKGLLAIAGLPYFTFSLIVSLPMWVAATYLRKNIKDRAFGNTVSFGVKLGLGAIWYPIVAALCFCLAPWFVALPITLLAIPTYNYFYDYMNFMRLYISDCRLCMSGRTVREAEEIRKDFERLYRKSI